MVKKAFLLVFIFVFLFLASGCVTVNTDGCCSNKQPAAPPCTERIIQVRPEKSPKVKAEKGPNILDQADNWVKENLW
jgi:hypothetical protein